MKRFLYLIGVLFLSLSVVSCGTDGGNGNDGGSKGKKFAPKERQSSLSDEERAAAIAQKRSEQVFGLDTLLYSHGVKIGIIEPKVQGDITEDVSHRIAIKMLEMAAQNGISGMGTSTSFLMGAEIAQTGRETTGTAPQKMVVKFVLTYKVINGTNGSVFASTKQEVTGVGASFEEASQQAVQSIENTSQVQQMLATASERIIRWYNENLGEFKRQVEQAASSGNFALALALVEGVPEQATAAANWATERQPKLFAELKHKIASENFAALQAAIATAGDEFDPAVGGFFMVIPSDAPEFAQAQALYDKYMSGVRARRADLEARAEREAAAQRLWDLEMAKMEHESDLARIEADKIIGQAEAQASAAASAAAAKKGFWGGLGDRVLGGIDFVSGLVGSLF